MVIKNVSTASPITLRYGWNVGVKNSHRCKETGGIPQRRGETCMEKGSRGVQETHKGVRTSYSLNARLIAILQIEPSEELEVRRLRIEDESGDGEFDLDRGRAVVTRGWYSRTRQAKRLYRNDVSA